jgi:hypothetical protein
MRCAGKPRPAGASPQATIKRRCHVALSSGPQPTGGRATRSCIGRGGNRSFPGIQRPPRYFDARASSRSYALPRPVAPGAFGQRSAHLFQGLSVAYAVAGVSPAHIRQVLALLVGNAVRGGPRHSCSPFGGLLIRLSSGTLRREGQRSLSGCPACIRTEPGSPSLDASWSQRADAYMRPSAWQRGRCS